MHSTLTSSTLQEFTAPIPEHPLFLEVQPCLVHLDLPEIKERENLKITRQRVQVIFLITGWIIYVRTFEQLNKVLPNRNI